MYTAAVITISDKGYRGERVDTSGPNLVEILKSKGRFLFDAALPAEPAGRYWAYSLLLAAEVWQQRELFPRIRTAAQ